MTDLARPGRRSVLAVLALLAGLAVAGCGEGDLPPRVDAPATLLPDGTVPWVDEPAGRREFEAGPPPRRPEAPGADGCRAEQLRGSLAEWKPKLRRDDFGEVLGNDGLAGEVRVRNTSAAACRLRGEVPVALLVDGRPLGIRRSHGVNREAQERVTTLAPGQEAVLRLDWSSPFCGEAAGRQVLVLTLPEDGGRLRAPVDEAARPPCNGQRPGPPRSSVLAASTFDEPSRPTRRDSPLGVLRARVEPGRAVPAGERLTYHVVLENPSGRAVRLDPCPGYLQERFSMAVPGQDNAVNDAQWYRLNCRPVRAIPAGGEVRFEMAATVPEGMAPGRELSIAWKLIGRRVPFSQHLAGEFSVVVP